MEQESAHGAGEGGSFLYVTARTDHRVHRYEIATGSVVTVVGPDGALYINHGGGDGCNDPVWIRKITRP